MHSKKSIQLVEEKPIKFHILILLKILSEKIFCLFENYEQRHFLKEETEEEKKKQQKTKYSNNREGLKEKLLPLFLTHFVEIFFHKIENAHNHLL